MLDCCYKNKTNIEKKDTHFRFEQLQYIAYHLIVSIPKGKKFSGQQTIHFDFKKLVPEEVSIDFHGEKVLKLTVNNKQVEQIGFDNHKIVIPADLLKQVGNKVEVLYETFYQNDGTGLHSFTDPQDNNQYLYTQFEAPYCHKFMPCFDQPNLKASLSLQVIAPSDWTVVANEIAKSQLPCPQDQFENALLQGHDSANLWTFYTTPRISTYLYALCAGSYFCKSKDGKVPLRIFCRKSYEKYLTETYTKEWFEITEHALSFYNDFMNIPYPYSKVDSVICPEYNFGAMENVGCITYTESILFKSEPTRKQETWMQNVIMHELAHQWFGNLITMHWWDDLWLNEAFATFIACLCQNSYKNVGDEAWLDLIKHQQWGINEDQKKSSHPIATKAADTQEAENLFDGISYGKGSAYLKQIYRYLSPEVFKKGVRLYFSKYANSNTNLKEFVTCLEVAKGESGVSEWVESWLTTKGVMKVWSEQLEENGLIKSFKVVQDFCQNADEVYKAHVMNIAFYYDDQVQIEEVHVQAKKETDLTKNFQGKKVPQAIMLDSGSYGYLKIQMDEKSLSYLLDNYKKIQNVIDRQNLISILINQVRDAQFSALKFMKFFASSLIDEPIAFIRESALQDALNYLGYLKKEDVERVSVKLFEVFVNKIQESTDSQVKIGYVNKLLQLLNNEKNVQKALNIIKEGKINSYTLNIKDKQSILVAINGSQHLKDDFKEEIVCETLKDNKDYDSEICRMQCKVIRPSLENKEEWWSKLINPPENMSQSDYGSITDCLLIPSQSELIGDKFIDSFFENLPRLFEEKVHFLARNYLFGCFPGRYQYGVDFTARLQQVIDQHQTNKMLSHYGESVMDAYKRRLAGQKIADSKDWLF